MVPKLLHFSKVVAPFSRSLSGIDFLMHFGRPLARLWLPLARLWLPLAPFWFPLAPFWLPSGTLWVLFGARWLPLAPFLLFLATFWFPLLSFSHPWAQFSCFFIHFSNFQVSSHFSRRFLQELRKIDWKRNGFSI